MSNAQQILSLDPTLNLVLSLLQRLRPEEKVVVKEFLGNKEKTRKEFRATVQSIWQKTQKYKQLERHELSKIVDEVRKDLYAQYTTTRRH